jgi:hypothetical protein
MFAEVNHDKLKTAFIAGRIDAAGERGERIPDGVELIIRIVLGETDIKALAPCAKVLFREREKLAGSPLGVCREESGQAPVDGRGLGDVLVMPGGVRP